MYKPQIKVLTVSQVNRYIKTLLAEDALLSGILITGELSNVKLHNSGHLYFTLKDENAALNGVMFRSNAERLPFTVKNGMKAVVGGYISLYEKTGVYQVYAEYMEPAGTGGLQEAFLQLKERLLAEGLFDERRKRPIPRDAKRVAVVTSPDGAAVRDIIKVISARNPTIKIVIAPAKVQGEGAAADIARALAEVNAWGGADVIIAGRGGGSMEDLWAFNEEITARALAASRIPVISAVGHETDFTIADFAADLRAPTPTAAAMAFVSHAEAADGFKRVLSALHYTINKRIDVKNEIEPLFRGLGRSIRERLLGGRAALDARAELLNKLSPWALWERGFTYVNDMNGEAVTSVKSLTVGGALNLYFKDGTAAAEVTGLGSE